MTRLSVCTIAYDEEEFIVGWLEHLQGLADEIVLGVDSRTTDHTRELAGEYGARTVLFEWQDSFASARNITLDKARGDWVLVLDPDERLTLDGRHAIQAVVAEDVLPLHVDGYTPLFAELNDDGQETSREWVAGRLFLNSPHLRYVGRVHEEVRYLPEPARTWFDHLPGNEPHIVHLGHTPTMRAKKGKDARDLRLLRMRLEDNPNDAVALFYLWKMSGEPSLAERALACGERALHPDRRVQLKIVLERVSGADDAEPR